MSETAPALSSPSPLDTTLPSRRAEERFETVGAIGAGGMARVLLVRDRTLGREVALKVPATPSDASRIEREALVLARLDHPAIVPLYDSGRWEDGPWLAMRLVRGVTLGQALTRGSASLLRHVLDATEAMAHAHARGYVHRDLKPANVMVGTFGETQVIDWGLALAPDLPPLDGPRAGTASAMSPEQRRGEPADARSDVWALGAMIEAAAQASDRASPELQAIIARATAHDPRARYQDAAGLAVDLAAYLDGRRVSAYAYRPLDLLRRTLHAWRRELVVAGVITVVSIIALVLAFAQVREARDRSEERLAVMLVREAKRALSQENRAAAEVLAAHAEALGSSPETRGVLAAVDDSRPSRVDLGFDLDGCEVADLSATVVLCRTPAGVEVRTRAGRRWRVDIDNAGAALLSRHVAVLTAGGVVPLALRDGEAGPMRPLTECRHRLTRGRGGAAVAWGSRCAVRLSDRDGLTLEPLPNPCPAPGLRVIGLDPVAGRVLSLCHDGASWVDAVRYDTGLATDPAQPLAFSVAAIGDTLVIGESHGDIVLVDLRRPREHRRHRVHEGLVRELLVSPSGKLLALGDILGPALFDPAARAILWRFPSPRVSATFDGDALVLAHHNPEGHAEADCPASPCGVDRWRLDTLKPRALDLPAGITAIALSEDGSRAAVGSGTDLFTLDTASRTILLQRRWQDSVVSTIAAAPGTHDFIAHGQGALRLERLGERPGTVPVPSGLDPSMRFRRVAALSDGSLLVAAFGRFTGRLDARGELSHLTRRTLIDLATDPSGTQVIALDEERFLLCTKDLVPCGRDLGATAVATADPDRFATARAGSLATFDQDGRLDQTFAAPGADLLDVAIARRPDGTRLLAGAARDGSTWLFEEHREGPWAVLRDHEARVSAVALDPGGRFALIGGWDGRLVFWPVPVAGGDRRARVEVEWGLGLSDLVPSP